jgi:hypothetical protein
MRLRSATALLSGEDARFSDANRLAESGSVTGWRAA